MRPGKMTTDAEYTIAATRTFAGWVVGWALRMLTSGALYALGGYAALRAIGAV
jgi:hypothetical protein